MREYEMSSYIKIKIIQILGSYIRDQKEYMINNEHNAHRPNPLTLPLKNSDIVNCYSMSTLDSFFDQ